MKSAITVLFISFIIFDFSQAKEVNQELIDSLFENQNYEVLVGYLENELKQDPENEKILTWLGQAYYDKKNYDYSKQYFYEAIALNPNCVRCYTNLGFIYYMQNDGSKAIEYLDKSVNADPENALSYSNRALVKELLGSNAASLIDHNKAIELDPENAELYVRRALYNENMGLSSLAIVDYNKAVQLLPDNYNVYLRRANFYYSDGQYGRSLDDINKAIEIDSSQSELYNSRAVIYAHALNDFEKAIVDYSKAISLNPSNPIPYFNRANLHYKQENMDASCTDYFIAKSKMKENDDYKDESLLRSIKSSIKDICDSTKPSYYYQRGIAYFNLEAFENAVEMYAEGLQYFPENGMILNFKGNALFKLDAFEEALKYYELSLDYKDSYLEEVKLNPRFENFSNNDILNFFKASLAETYFQISKCHLYLNAYDKALSSINKAIESDSYHLDATMGNFDNPNRTSYYNLRGYIYLFLAKYDLALDDFNKSIKINSDFALAYVNRAVAKVSQAEQVKTRAGSVNLNVHNQPLNFNWSMPDKRVIKRSEDKFLSAISDCTIAISLDDTLAYAYYIRGQIKKAIQDDGYCLDLIIAKALGLNVEADLLMDCEE